MKRKGPIQTIREGSTSIPIYRSTTRTMDSLRPFRFEDGPVAGIYQTWQAIWEQWIPTSGLKPVHAPEIERYDHRYQRASRDGIVEIWTPVTAV